MMSLYNRFKFEYECKFLLGGRIDEKPSQHKTFNLEKLVTVSFLLN